MGCIDRFFRWTDRLSDDVLARVVAWAVFTPWLMVVAAVAYLVMR